MKLIALACLLACSSAFAQSLVPTRTDIRFCGFPVKRDADGSIHRSTATVEAFKKRWPLPPGERPEDWQGDPPVPLECGGCDAVWNMQWLKKSIKTCAGTECKDRWEK